MSLRLLSALLAAILLLAAGPADAKGPLLGAAASLANPLLHTVANRCTRLIRRAGNETLVNTCNACLMVSVSRKRSGIALPVRRSFTVAAGSQFPVPFRGPGHTRITSEVPCKGAAPNLVNPEPLQRPEKAIQCVQLKKGSSGNPVLFNSCSQCRAAAIRRLNGAGSPLGQQAYILQPNAVVSVESRGAAAVGLLADIDCPS